MSDQQFRNYTPLTAENYRTLYSLHLALVTGLTALLLFFAITYDSARGCDIGAGFVVFLLDGMGLPWSAVTFELVAQAPPPAFRGLVLVIAPAFLNVGLHALLRRYVQMRRKARATSSS